MKETARREEGKEDGTYAFWSSSVAMRVFCLPRRLRMSRRTFVRLVWSQRKRSSSGSAAALAHPRRDVGEKRSMKEGGVSGSVHANQERTALAPKKGRRCENTKRSDANCYPVDICSDAMGLSSRTCGRCVASCAQPASHARPRFCKVCVAK